MVGMYYRSHQLKIQNGKRKLLEGETDWSALLFNYLLIFTFLIFPTVSTKVRVTFSKIDHSGAPSLQCRIV
jgi:hypothetical protein